MQVHIGQEEDLHMTVFMTSHPFDVRRDAFAVTPVEPAEGWDAISAKANAERERSTVKGLAENAQAPLFEVSLMFQMGLADV